MAVMYISVVAVDANLTFKRQADIKKRKRRVIVLEFLKTVWLSQDF